ADKSLIRFDLASRPAHLCEGSGLHCESDSVHHEPSGLLSDPDIAGNFVRANAVLTICQQPSSGKPFLQRNGRILVNGTDLEREFLLGVLPVAAIEPRLVEIGNLFGVAVRAAN